MQLYAKTLFQPERPADIDEAIKAYTSLKLPHFFKYAKNKEERQLVEANQSVVNRLSKLIHNPRLRFNLSNVGDFQYINLMNNKDVELNPKIIERYDYIAKTKSLMFKKEKEHRREDRMSKEVYINNYIRQTFTKEFGDIVYVTDVLIKYLFESQRTNKNILWDSFGHIIVGNLRINVPDSTKQCVICGSRFEYNEKSCKPTLYCKHCADKMNLEKTRKKYEKKQEKKVNQK